MGPQSGARAPQLAAYYFLYFACVGITLPFLPAYFIGLGLNATEVGALLALSPLVGLFAPPLFGRWADRSGAAARVLTVATIGTVLALFPMMAGRSFGALALAVAAYAFFDTALVPLVDALTLDAVSETGTSYAHVRLFGSLGFIVAAVGFSFASEHVGPSTLWIPAILFAVAAVVSARMDAPGVRPFSAVRTTWRADAGLWILCIATALHWIACAPYHGTFILHVEALGLPNSVVGVSAALGVVAEVLAMWLYPRIARRIPAKVSLLVAFAMSVVRWIGMAIATHAVPIAALTLLHGFSFGLFYVAAIDAVNERVGQEHRVRGQAFFAAVTFGLGGLVGYLAAGAGYQRFGGAVLFGLAAVAEGLAVAVLLPLRPVAAPTR